MISKVNDVSRFARVACEGERDDRGSFVKSRKKSRIKDSDRESSARRVLDRGPCFAGLRNRVDISFLAERSCSLLLSILLSILCNVTFIVDRVAMGSKVERGLVIVRSDCRAEYWNIGIYI